MEKILRGTKILTENLMGMITFGRKLRGAKFSTFKGYEMITFEWGYEFFKCHFITLNHKAILKVYENHAA